jgi:hypothetical protein
VLARVADKVRNDDLDGGAVTIDEALAELEAKHRRSQVLLLEEGGEGRYPSSRRGHRRTTY